MIPMTILYDLGSVANLQLLLESPYGHLKHANSFSFNVACFHDAVERRIPNDRKNIK